MIIAASVLQAQTRTHKLSHIFWQIRARTNSSLDDTSQEYLQNYLTRFADQSTNRHEGRADFCKASRGHQSSSKHLYMLLKYIKIKFSHIYNLSCNVYISFLIHISIMYNMQLLLLYFSTHIPQTESEE